MSLSVPTKQQMLKKKKSENLLYFVISQMTFESQMYLFLFLKPNTIVK